MPDTLYTDDFDGATPDPVIWATIDDTTCASSQATLAPETGLLESFELDPDSDKEDWDTLELDVTVTLPAEKPSGPCDLVWLGRVDAGRVSLAVENDLLILNGYTAQSVALPPAATLVTLRLSGGNVVALIDGSTLPELVAESVESILPGTGNLIVKVANQQPDNPLVIDAVAISGYVTVTEATPEPEPEPESTYDDTTDDLIPTVDDVALLLRTRTAGISAATGGLGGDTGPVDVTTFDEDTRPTGEEVEAVIDQAFHAMSGRFAGPIPDASEGTARHAIALYAAVMIEVSFFRETMNQELITLWQGMIDKAVETVNDAVTTTTGAKTWGVLTIGTTIPTSGQSWSPEDELV